MNGPPLRGVDPFVGVRIRRTGRPFGIDCRDRICPGRDLVSDLDVLDRNQTAHRRDQRAGDEAQCLLTTPASTSDPVDQLLDLVQDLLEVHDQADGGGGQRDRPRFRLERPEACVGEPKM